MIVACLWSSLKYAGTVITASVTFSHRYFSASSFNFAKTCELISSGLTVFPLNSIRHSQLEPFTTLKGTFLISDCTSSNLRPMNLFAE